VAKADTAATKAVGCGGENTVCSMGPRGIFRCIAASVLSAGFDIVSFIVAKPHLRSPKASQRRRKYPLQ
jgi:hypothetical protein